VKIILVNVNTSESMTEVIAAGARRYASPGTQTVALRPFFGPEAVDCNFESYLSAVGVMDRVLAYDESYDAVVLAGFGEHGRDGLQELIDQPVIEICEASAYVAMLIARSYSVVTTLQRSVPAIEDRLRLAGVAERCASVRASGMSTPRSLAGMLEATHIKAPPGSAAPRSRASSGSLSPGSVSSTESAASLAAASARRQESSQPTSEAAGTCRTRTELATSVAVRAGSAQRPSGWPSTTWRVAPLPPVRPAQPSRAS
jgi:hypothetical protein